MSIGSRIKERRLALDLTQEELATRLGVSKGAIANYENEVSTPKPDILFKVISALECDANYLFQDMVAQVASNALTPRECAVVGGFRRLDDRGKETIESVLQKELEMQSKYRAPAAAESWHKIYYDFPVSAGTGEFLDDSTAVVAELEDEPPAGTDYILRIAGDSMEPRYPDGCYVYVQRTESVEQGEIGIFICSGSVYMKQYTREGLRSLNPAYGLIPGSEDIRCLGRVLGTVSGKMTV